MITTIQIHENVRQVLEKLKESAKDTYEDVIVKMINETECKKRTQKELLIEGYKEMAKENLKITKEFENLDQDFDWKW